MAASHPDYPMWSALLRWSLTQTDGTDEAQLREEAARRVRVAGDERKSSSGVEKARRWRSPGGRKYKFVRFP